MVRAITPHRPEEPKAERVSTHWAHEMALRRREQLQAAGLAHPPLAPIKPAHFDWLNPNADQDMFEAACDALMNSRLHPENGFVPEAAPGFAALLVRIAEQTAAEFGKEAAACAFRWMADAMEKPPREGQ